MVTRTLRCGKQSWKKVFLRSLCEASSGTSENQIHCCFSAWKTLLPIAQKTASNQCFITFVIVWTWKLTHVKSEQYRHNNTSTKGTVSRRIYPQIQLLGGNIFWDKNNPVKRTSIVEDVNWKTKHADKNKKEKPIQERLKYGASNRSDDADPHQLRSVTMRIVSLLSLKWLWESFAAPCKDYHTPTFNEAKSKARKGAYTIQEFHISIASQLKIKPNL